METGSIIITLAIIIGLLVLALIVYSGKKPKESQGILNVDHSDPIDGPYLFLELKVPVADVISRKQVIFDVCVKQYVSHK